MKNPLFQDIIWRKRGFLHSEYQIYGLCYEKYTGIDFPFKALTNPAFKAWNS